MLSRVIATNFVRVMTSGRTCPLLCGCTDVQGRADGEFVVKILGQPTAGQRGALYEFVGSRLANHFGILVPEAAVVEITQEFGRLVSHSQPQMARIIK
jgi:hypothetical protein